MAQWDPFREIEALRREIDRAFAEFGLESEPFFRSAFLPGRLGRGYPLVNIYEDKENFYVEAMAPGIKPESLNLTVVHNTLTISGEKAGLANGVKREDFHREERAAGKFVRTVTLPAEIDDAKVRAEYKNGILLVTLPKAEKAKPKQIEVKVS